MAKNKQGRNINGILLLNKDTGISSNKALQQVKKIFNAKKAGHTGSLDPLANGILPICLGEATKFATYLLNDNKSYIVTAKLGISTTTFDIEGEITKQKPIDNINIQKIKQTIKKFIGTIKQVAPIYSALKVNGVPMYKLARQNITVQPKIRTITIYSIEFISYTDEQLTIEVACSKGTYIRSLIHDIGNKLNCGATVAKLKRNKFAHFNLDNSIKLIDLIKLKTIDYKALDAKLLNSENVLINFNNINLTDKETSAIKFGQRVYCNKPSQIIKIFNKNIFLGLGVINNNTLQAKRLINL